MGLKLPDDSCVSEGQQVGEQFRDVGRNDRFGVVVALSGAATEVEEYVALGELLDAFCDQLEAQDERDAHDGIDKCPLAG